MYASRDVGRSIDERYTVIGQIGRGGIAHVHLVHDPVEDQLRALKMMAPEHARRPSLVARFVAEARMLQRLRHPNLLRAHEAGLAGARPYIVMEYAAGGSLGDWLDRNGPMPPAMAARVCVEICNGVIAVHQVGILHRDIKPDNVLLTADHRVVVGDFGLARTEVAGLTRTGTSLGTLGYVAPEQLDDASSVDEATDVYSIGATLFAVVTGTLPPNDLYMRDPWDPCFDGIEQPLLMVIVQATRRSRSQRIGAVSTLQNMLRRVLPQLPPDPPSTPSIAELAALRGFTDPSRSAPRRLLASLRTRVPVPSRNSAADTFVSPLPSPCRVQQPSTVPGAPERQARPSPPTRRGWASLFRNLTGACETTGA